MKLTFIGAGGARTPLVIQSILNYQDRTPVRRVCLMDIDAERLGLMRLASQARLEAAHSPIQFTWTTDPQEAVRDADFVVTTFRAGLMESRVVDEQVPLKYGVLGQETTGPGGFAMALRTIPTLLEYVRLIRDLAPGAWLLNFTNPAGMATEAVTRMAGYERVVGICDNPSAMVRGVAQFLSVAAHRIYPEYYGLNHLGWLRAAYLDGRDWLPDVLRAVSKNGAPLPHLPFDPRLIESLGALPNEYLYFYYAPRESVEHLLQAGQSRAQQILPFNQALYGDLRRIREEEANPAEVDRAYARYLHQRHSTYMTLETGEPAAPAPAEPADLSASAEGYSGVALDLIEALTGGGPATPILNVPNRGALPGMADDDVVEVTCFAGSGVIRPIAMGPLPDHALGLMKSVKAYERLTIEAAVEGSYNLALKALALHPLVPSFEIARAILDDYIEQHGSYFPKLR